MKVVYSGKKLRVEIEGKNQKDIFKQLAQFQSVFEEPACGMCASDQIQFETREHDGNTFYGMRCRKCGAELNFGSHKTGDTLFVKRVDKDRNPVGKNGWHQWEPNSRGEAF